MYATDDYGHFFIENEMMNALGTLVKVEKDGFFEGSRRFFPIAGEQSRVKIQLLEKSFDNNFNAASGGNVALSNGASIDFSPNSIQTADGSTYTGTVNVAMKWLDPSTNAALDQMPGNLQGLNGEVEQVVLGTYGMVAVELQDDAGEALNIADGSTAEITMPVPASMLNGAPDEIPLWSYHEDLGLWVQESTATLQGDKYVGEVTHFSFWNCDIPFDNTLLEMTLVDVNGVPLTNYFVTLTVVGGSNSSFQTSGSGYTNGNGTVSGVIPANADLLMEVRNVCGDALYSQTIGPFNTNANVDLGNITITGTGINSTIISGNLLDCNSLPVTNGLVIAEFQGEAIYQYTTTSNFVMNVTTCTNTSNVEVTGINLDSFEESAVLSAPPNSTTDFGNINTCINPLQNYVSITIDGVNALFFDAQVFSTPDTTNILVADPNQQYFTQLGFPGDNVGNYQNTANVQYIYNQPMNWGFGEADLSTFDVTQYSTVITGSYTGEVQDSLGNILPISCTFSVDN